MKRAVKSIFLVALTATGTVSAQTINEYTISRAGDMVMDGVLDEAAWQEAPYTENFVTYAEGNESQFPTRAKMLWDDTNLYVAFELTDDDIWSTMTQHDGSLYREEVVEIFIDPNGDGENYFEIEINPLGTVWDLWLNHPWSIPGASATSTWDIENFTQGNGLALVIDGTVNDDSDTDNGWVMECRIPFAEIGFNDPDMAFPPNEGDSWRLNLYRFERRRPVGPGSIAEETAWNQTDDRQFHAPDLFGKVIFQGTSVGVMDSVEPSSVDITGNFPNPFNPSTAIEFSLPSELAVSLDMYTVTGQRVRKLTDRVMPAGIHRVVWDGAVDAGETASTGLYIAYLRAGDMVATHRMLLMK